MAKGECAVREWTKERHARMQALCDAATPGEWVADGTIVRFPSSERIIDAIKNRREIQCVKICDCTNEIYIGDDAISNAAFIAAARSGLPAALREIERLHAILAGREGGAD